MTTQEKARLIVRDIEYEIKAMNEQEFSPINEYDLIERRINDLLVVIEGLITPYPQMPKLEAQAKAERLIRTEELC
jgi:hypothetical protein